MHDQSVVNRIVLRRRFLRKLFLNLYKQRAVRGKDEFGCRRSAYFDQNGVPKDVSEAIGKLLDGVNSQSRLKILMMIFGAIRAFRYEVVRTLSLQMLDVMVLDKIKRRIPGRRNAAVINK